MASSSCLAIVGWGGLAGEGQAFASRTYAELAAVTVGIPAGLTIAKPLTPVRAQGEAIVRVRFRSPAPGLTPRSGAYL